jgi:hypothetical protein
MPSLEHETRGLARRAAPWLNNGDDSMREPPKEALSIKSSALQETPNTASNSQTDQRKYFGDAKDKLPAPDKKELRHPRAAKGL